MRLVTSLGLLEFDVRARLRSVLRGSKLLKCALRLLRVRLALLNRQFRTAHNTGTRSLEVHDDLELVVRQVLYLPYGGILSSLDLLVDAHDYSLR